MFVARLCEICNHSSGLCGTQYAVTIVTRIQECIHITTFFRMYMYMYMYTQEHMCEGSIYTCIVLSHACVCLFSVCACI